MTLLLSYTYALETATYTIEGVIVSHLLAWAMTSLKGLCVPDWPFFIIFARLIRNSLRDNTHSKFSDTYTLVWPKLRLQPQFTSGQVKVP